MINFKPLVKTILTTPNNLIVKGRAGIGKTYTVKEALKESGLVEDKDFIIIRGYSTPLSFYNSLYNYKDIKVILLDDVEGVFYNHTAKAILKGVLDVDRVAEYHTTHEITIPERFTINAKLIILCNHLPYDDDFKAVIDRCFFIEYDLNNDEILKLADNIYTDKDLLLHLRNIIMPYHEEFSFRTINKAIELKQSTPDCWKDRIQDILLVNETHKLVYEMEQSGLKLNEAYPRYKALSGKSYQTFMRIRRKLGLKRYEVKP